jgi:hypothetical protein
MGRPLHAVVRRGLILNISSSRFLVFSFCDPSFCIDYFI